MSESFDLEKYRSIGVQRRTGETETVVTKEGGARVVHEKHWDGRVDATVTPPTVRYGATVHKTGTKKGQVAEVRELTARERRDRHGEG